MKVFKLHCGVDVLNDAEQKELLKNKKLHNEMLKPKKLTACYKNKYNFDKPKFTEKQSEYIKNYIKLQTPIIEWNLPKLDSFEREE